MTTSSKRVYFNILPESYRRGLFTVQQAALVTLAVVMLALMVPVYILASESVAGLSTLKVEKEAIEIQVRSVQTKQQAVSQLQAETGKYRAVLDKRGALSDQYLLLVSGAVVPGIHLSEVVVTREDMTLNLTADNVQSLWAYEDALREIEEFAEVVVGMYVVKSGDVAGSYRITISMDAG